MGEQLDLVFVPRVASVAEGTYPGFAVGSDTSREAAATVAGELGERQRAVLEALRRMGSATGEEIAGVLGRPTYTVLPRLTELALRGLVEDTGRRGVNRSGRRAAVWRATRSGVSSSGGSSSSY